MVIQIGPPCLKEQRRWPLDKLRFSNGSTITIAPVDKENVVRGLGTLYISRFAIEDLLEWDEEFNFINFKFTEEIYNADQFSLHSDL